MILVSNNDIEIDVRAGTAADVPLLLSFIRAMADFEKLTVAATEDGLREALFGDRPAAQTLLAFVDGKPVGYATYFFTFSSMLGRRGLWLDDLFVDAAYRSQGIGEALMAYLADVALENQCARFEWVVLDWNASAIRFYERLGATFASDWRVCRLDGTRLSDLAGKLVVGE